VLSKKGKISKALAYTHKNWDKLTEYIKDGRLNIDHNPVGNANRLFAIDQKNWLLSDSQSY
jgi:transposase